MKRFSHSIYCAMVMASLSSFSALAADPVGSALEDSGVGAEHVNVDAIKNKYWARGDESELGVVQNRLYSKEHKFELGIFGGLVASDPFLSTQSIGGSLGYHFSEYFSASVFAFKDFAGPSSALELLQQPTVQGGLGTDANTNIPKWFLGAEATGSFLYGKLSLIGKAIIHYDMHVLVGLGETSTENGTYVTPYVGIGQQVYLAKSVALRLDYRIMRYSETIVQKVIPTQRGNIIGDRINYSSVITLGLSFLIDPFSKKVVAAEPATAVEKK